MYIKNFDENINDISTMLVSQVGDNRRMLMDSRMVEVSTNAIVSDIEKVLRRGLTSRVEVTYKIAANSGSIRRLDVKLPNACFLPKCKSIRSLILYKANFSLISVSIISASV